MHGIGYLSRQVLAFNDLKSTHKRKAPHFLRANKTACPYSDVEGEIRPFFLVYHLTIYVVHQVQPMTSYSSGAWVVVYTHQSSQCDA